MQLRLKPRQTRGLNKSFIVKTALVVLIFFAAIFFLDKINMPVPTKLIEHEISNDKLKTLK